MRISSVIAAEGSMIGRIWATSDKRTRRVRALMPTVSFRAGIRPDVTHRRAIASEVLVILAASVILIQASPGYSSALRNSSTYQTFPGFVSCCSIFSSLSRVLRASTLKSCLAQSYIPSSIPLTILNVNILTIVNVRLPLASQSDSH